MHAEEWRPTPHLAYHAGALQQKWTRRVWESRQLRGAFRPTTFEKLEEEWRDVPERGQLPQPGEQR